MPPVAHRTARRTDDGNHGEPVPLHYAVVGDAAKPPLALLHGFPEDHAIFLPLADRLCERFRLILPDLRGTGLSGRPFGGYDVGTLAGDLACVLDHAGVRDPCPMVGHDVGGMVAVAYALTFPDRVTALVDVEGPPPGLTAEGWEPFAAQFWHFGFFAQPDLPELLIGGRERQFCAWFVRRYAGRRGAVPLELTDAMGDALAADGGLRGALGTYRATGESGHQMRALLAGPDLPVPVLALGGERCLGDWVGKLLAPAAADVTTETVPDCGHWVPHERPGRLADRLLAFLPH